MFSILLNTGISNLFTFIDNAAANIFGRIKFFCIFGYFLKVDSQKYNYTLSQRGVSVFKVLGTYYQIAFQNSCVNLYFQDN